MGNKIIPLFHIGKIRINHWNISPTVPLVSFPYVPNNIANALPKQKGTKTAMELPLHEFT
jgi:hypothetical protein